MANKHGYLINIPPEIGLKHIFKRFKLITMVNNADPYFRILSTIPVVVWEYPDSRLTSTRCAVNPKPKDQRKFPRAFPRLWHSRQPNLNNIAKAIVLNQQIK